MRRNQRERLYAAMVASAAQKGYTETSVADLLALSGVSRRAFYEHFDGKEACFLATLDEILEAATAAIASRMRRAGPWEERAQRSLDAFIELLISQPAAARLCLVEAHAAGPAARRRMEEGFAAFEELLAQTYEQQPAYAGMPAELVRALAGGFRKIVHTRLHRGAERELAELAPELLKLGLAYRPPPQPLRTPRRRPPAPPAGHHPVKDPGERIVRATLAVVAEKGFSATTIGDISRRARVSLSTFYERFDGKAEAFDAALYSARARMNGYTVPIYRRAKSWPEGIRAVVEASLAFFAREPDFAKLIAVDVYAAGPEALERRDQAIEAAQRFVDEGVEEHAPQMKPIWREAIINYLYVMVCNRVQDGDVKGLESIGPLATYTALCPFLGPEDACTVANGGRWAETPQGRS